jgi:hypothetical protein
MFEFMGVRIDPIESCTGGEFENVSDTIWPESSLPETSKHGYVLDPRVNDSFIAVNRLLVKGANISRAKGAVDCGEAGLPPGAFIVKSAGPSLLEKVSKELHLVFHPLEEDVEKTVVEVARIGMYQRYWGGNMDEGWTRFLLEQFEFPYTTLMDEDIKKGNLKQEYDTIILPNDPEAMITGVDINKWWDKHYPWWPLPTFPPEYRSGIGEEGVEALKEFVEQGGTLICFDGASELAINQFKLKIKNVLEGVGPKEFFCPGSTLHANVDTYHPAAYGMPEDSLILFWNSQAFDIIPSSDNDKYEVVVSYPERDIMESGWLIGEEKIKRKSAMVIAKHGKGKIALIGFRPQHRAQTHGTYKLLFNSLLC